MGIYLRLLPGVKARITRRGVRWGIGAPSGYGWWGALIARARSTRGQGS